MTLSGRLDIGGVGRAMVAEHDRQSGHTFQANQSDLDFLAVALNGDDRCKARLRKIDRFDPFVGLCERFFRNSRVTDPRCGASKSKSLGERDESNLLRLDTGRSSHQAGARISQPPTPAALGLSR